MTAKDSLRAYFNRVRENAPLLARVLPKPALLWFWVSRARQSQKVAAILIVIFLVIVTPALSWLSEYLYPVKDKGILNVFFNTGAKYELQHTRYLQFLVLAWLLCATAVIVQFIHELGEILKQAQQHAANSILEVTEQINIPQQRFLGGQRYRIDRAIASGGMGVVYQAFDTVLQRTVAIKELFNSLAGDDDQVARFRQEARTLAQMAHPHIVPVYDFLEEQGQVWIVMEYLDGGNLQNLLEQGPIPLQRSLDIVCALATGLAFAKGQGVTHRDIKPLNILFARDGTPKLADFGTAKLTSTPIHTQQGLVIGSPRYMSPEQAAGEHLDWRSDVYSLGATWFHMLTGETPFEGDTAELMAKHITQQPPVPRELNPDIPEAVEKLLMKMLAKKPGDRFAQPAELVEALAAAKQANA